VLAHHQENVVWVLRPRMWVKVPMKVTKKMVKRVKRVKR
jgi:hypothetical protein